MQKSAGLHKHFTLHFSIHIWDKKNSSQSFELAALCPFQKPFQPIKNNGYYLARGFWAYWFVFTGELFLSRLVRRWWILQCLHSETWFSIFVQVEQWLADGNWVATGRKKAVVSTPQRSQVFCKHLKFPSLLFCHLYQTFLYLEWHDMVG